MKVIVTTKENIKIEGYKVVDRIKDRKWDGVEVIIYNSSNDTELDAVLSISAAAPKVPKKIYMNEDLNPTMYGMFAGLGGDIYTDESYFEDKAALDYIVDYYGETGVNLKLPVEEVERINTFVEKLSTEGAEGENVDEVLQQVRDELVMQTVRTSIETVSTALQVSNESSKEMVNLFTTTTNMLTNLTKENDTVMQEIAALNRSLSEAQRSLENKGTNKTVYYPVHRVPDKTKKVMYVRVYSPCMYLTTYLSNFVHFLKVQKSVSAKVLLMIPQLKTHIKKYEALPCLAPETIRTIDFKQNGDVYVTHEPIAPVLDTFFNANLDLHIVVDMMYGDEMLKGKHGQIIEFSAFTVITDAKRFGVVANSSKVFVPSAGLSKNIRIPFLPTYLQQNITGNTTGLRTMYYEELKDMFEKTAQNLNIR